MSTPHSCAHWINLADEELLCWVSGTIHIGSNNTDDPTEIDNLKVVDSATERDYTDLLDDDNWTTCEQALLSSFLKH